MILWDLWLDLVDEIHELGIRGPQYIPYINVYTVGGFIIAWVFSMWFWERLNSHL